MATKLIRRERPRDVNEAHLPRAAKRLDQILARSDVFVIDPMACAAAARSIVSYRPAPTLGVENNSQTLLTKFVAAAICHQFNWDFLCQRLSANLPGSAVAADYLAEVSAATVGRWLDGYARPERIRAAERAGLLRDLGRRLVQHYSGLVTNMMTAADGRLLGDEGLLSRLDAFQAFGADPLRKKRNVFVHDIVRERLVRFEDENAIEPAIDYHIMRLYLRSGRVYPRNPEVLSLLKERTPTRGRLVRMLRESVAEAVRTTAFYASLTIPDINYIEWQVGRSLCHADDPSCADATALDGTDLESVCAGACPYSSFCLARNDAGWRELREPEIRTVFF